MATAPQNHRNWGRGLVERVTMWQSELALDPGLEALAHRVIGACLEVHRHLGPGFLESAYEEALCHELGLRGIAFERQFALAIHYKGILVGTGRVDVLVDRRLILELKAVDALAAVHGAQVLSYLKAADLKLGFVVNFNAATLRQGLKRVINVPA